MPWCQLTGELKLTPAQFRSARGLRVRRQRSQDDQDGDDVMDLFGDDDEDEAHVVVPGRSDLRGKHHIFKRNVISRK